MIASLTYNGVTWHVVRVGRESSALTDREGKRTVATTDPASRLICVSEDVSGDMLPLVLAHEATHAAMVSFSMLDSLHAMILPGCEVEAEEWACELVAGIGGLVWRTVNEMVRPRKPSIDPSVLLGLI